MAALTFAVATPLAAHAASGFYLGAGAGANLVPAEDLRNGDVGVVNSKTTPGFALGFDAGYGFDNGLRPEVAIDFRKNNYKTAISQMLGGTTSPADETGHTDATYGMLNLWYDIKRPSGLFKDFHPYLGGGVGYGTVRMSSSAAALGGDLAGDSQGLFGYQGGAGFSYDLSRNVALTLDYRYFQTNKGSFAVNPAVAAVAASGDDRLSARYRAQSLGLGLQFSFAAAPPPPVAAAPAPLPAAMPPPPPPPPPPPVDSDGDGVPDNLDKCPGTPPGFKVDADGCIIMQTIVLHAVNFKTNSDQLTDADKQSIDSATAQLLTAMRAQSSLHLEVDGHTDSRGSASYNMKLSDKRATSVKNYLVSKGFDATRVTSHGFGATKPIASNDTADGRTQNRRVEFVITGAAGTGMKIMTEGATSETQNSGQDASKPAPAKKKTK